MSADQSRRSQFDIFAGTSFVMPSHHTSFSSVIATLVKIVLAEHAAIAIGFVSSPVPGATPKKPFSGLIAWSLRGVISSNMLGGASQTVSMIRVQCNGT